MNSCSVYDSSLFGNCLEDLTITELLVLQRSLQKVSLLREPIENHSLSQEAPECIDLDEGKCQKPSSLALVAEGRGYASSHPDPWQLEEKPSKLQTLFQISVTALSFLSFGGYLLCLIVHSIKSKGTTYFTPMATTMAPANTFKRIKVYRRSRRSSVPPFAVSRNYTYGTGQSVNPYQYYYKENN
ncbi:uncharacterized protein LOC142229228 [Haematobia irritans]|uniref:uncharacterized protein LOC142229228 n=1 Tax=Haematobia irritans TaxID=7368 RepID=UPI003F5090E7